MNLYANIGIQPIPPKTFSNLSKAVLAIVFLSNIGIFYRRFNLQILFLSLISVIVILLNILVFPETQSVFLKTAVSFYSMCFTLYVTVVCVRDFGLLFRKLKTISYIISAVMVAYLGVIALGLNRFSDEYTYSMGFGYSLLIPILILIWDCIVSRSIWSLISAIILLIGIVSFGSRGPLLGIALFGFFMGVRYFLSRKKYLQAVCILLLFCLLLFEYKHLLLFLENLLDALGIESRTLRLLRMDLFYTSGREVLQEQLWKALEEHPFMVRGINADQLLLGTYAHSIVLELLYEFGIVFGALILALIFAAAVKTLSKKKLETKNVICLILIFTALPQLFVSGSFWDNYPFWLWIGILVNQWNSNNESFIRKEENRI